MGQYTKQMYIAACINVGSAIVGYGMGWSAPVIPKLQDEEQSPLPGPVTDGQASWVGSLLYVGTITGPYITGYLSNVLGRKPCLLLGGVISLISFVILALARSIITIYIGRILNGVGIGIIFVMNLVYVGEIASTSIRGILLTLTGIFGTVGTLIVYAVGPYVPYSVTSWLGTVLSGVYMAGIFTIPETPVFQVMTGQEKEATSTLLALGRVDEIDSVLSVKHTPPTRSNEWTQLFSIYTNRKALFITLTLSMLQQLSGVVAVMFFATNIFQLAGSSVEPNIATIIIGVTQIAASSITPFFVDRTGRKPLLLISTLLACLSHAVLGVYFHLDIKEASVVDEIQWLPLVSLVIFFLSYDLGFGIIPGTLIGEMFTSNVRSSGSVFVATIGWLVGFGVSTAFGYMLPAFGADVTFWIYSGACAVAFFFSLIFVPETKGKSLAEILDMLSK